MTTLHPIHPRPFDSLEGAANADIAIPAPRFDEPLEPATVATQAEAYACGHDIGERQGYRAGWWWGLICGATLIGALAAGLAWAAFLAIGDAQLVQRPATRSQAAPVGVRKLTALDGPPMLAVPQSRRAAT